MITTLLHTTHRTSRTTPCCLTAELTDDEHAGKHKDNNYFLKSVMTFLVEDFDDTI